MKKFRVVVEGETFEVEVEEMGGAGGNAAPQIQTAKPQTAPAPKANPAPQAEAPKSAPAPSSGGGGNTVDAPIAGNVLDIKVSTGDQVENGQVVAILEAMKMENEITAEASGTVKEVKVSKGATVNSGDTLIVLE